MKHKVKTQLHREGDCVFLHVQLYEGTEGPKGKIAWVPTNSRDMNLHYDHTLALANLVQHGWLTADEVSKLLAEAAKLAGRAA